MELGKVKVAAALAATVAALAACENPPTKQQVGAVSGAVVGGVVGSTIGGGTGRTVAILAGTVAGAVIGGKIGSKMDEADKLKAAQALESTPTGKQATWKNPDTGAEYTLTPTKTTEASAGPCRDFTVDAKIEGSPEKIEGTACRQADGSWKAKG
jgi:surface antigen